MRRYAVLVISLLMTAADRGSAAGTGPAELIYHTRCVTNLAPGSRTLVTLLEAEVAKIIGAGHLMPFRVQYGEGRPRHHFAEPWIMMLTLARGYSYVGTNTQSAIRDYVEAETKLHPPWSSEALGPTGAYRQGDPKGAPEVGLPPKYNLTGTMFYALWLYGFHTGDWGLIQPQWNNLQAIYAQLKRSPPTYETINGAIAMARMAREFNDGAAETRFAADAADLMQAGKNFESFRRNAHLAYSGKPDWYRGSDGITFALFHLTPEVAHYIKDQPELKRATEAYVDQALTIWPLWWMAQAPVGDGGYFDEGCCAGPETRMMLFSYLAWVRQKPAAELSRLVDVPDALVGDCYYLQNLVTAIEAWGQTEFR